MNESFEISLLENWSLGMQHLDLYKEPFLDEFTINVIKVACDTFKQDLQVFFMSVDVLEHFIYLKNIRREKIPDPLLYVGVSIFVTSKFIGGGADLKVPHIEKFLFKLTNQSYHFKIIMNAEHEFLSVIEYQLPFSTSLDDFETFFEKYIKEYRLKDLVRPLCIEILQLLYLTRTKWFFELKKFYKEELKTFQYLMCSKLYLPAGILLSAFKTTNYQFILDIDGVLQDLRIVSKIHPDHIHALSAVILDLMKN